MECRKLAIGLVSLAAVPLASAGYVPIDFGTHYNRRMQDRNDQYPEGSVTLGGVPFEIPVGVNNEWGSGDGIGGGGGNDGQWILELDVSVVNAETVYMLINTIWGTTQNGRMLVDFSGSDGAHAQWDLIGNDDIRDWSGNFTNTINGTTTVNVFTDPDGQAGNPDYLDMVRFDLPDDFQGQTLQTIRVTDNRQTFVHSGIVSGITVDNNEPCSPADIAPPFGVLDLNDLNAFVNDFLAGCP